MEEEKTRTSDPTEFFASEIVEKIFSYLEAFDLKMSMLVSQNWNRHISSSARCMDRFVVMLQCIGDEVKPIPSNRNYQKISFGGGRISEKRFNSIYAVMNSKRWKYVNLSSLTFESTSSLMKLIETFESTVETLKISSVTVADEDVEATRFEFKQLKRLIYSMDNREKKFATPLDMFENCSSLRLFYFESPIVEYVEMLVRILQKQKNLKILSVNFRSNIQSFSGFYAFPFQLEDLVMIFHSEKSTQLALSLMQNQAKLKHLALDPIIRTNYNVLNAVLGLKSLEELSFQRNYFLDFESPPLTLSKSVHTFRINGDIDNERAKKILNAMPNVKRIKLFNVDEELAHFFAKSMRNLEILTACEIDVVSVQRILPGVRICKIEFGSAYRLIERDPEIMKPCFDMTPV